MRNICSSEDDLKRMSAVLDEIKDFEKTFVEKSSEERLQSVSSNNSSNFSYKLCRKNLAKIRELKELLSSLENNASLSYSTNAKKSLYNCESNNWMISSTPRIKNMKISEEKM